ncbi:MULTISPECIES: hypothetical protein [Diaphorobacter]|uniref:hypothetical protein n=1 Tax=Diaphorobacter TaxID=238749 RepID=UPI0020512052|nr:MULTISPECIES: hypothetical protein [Diaphorobacter]UOB06633.1 hypothetical protein MRB47_05860 [Diaphorobacter sp. LI3]
MKKNLENAIRTWAAGGVLSIVALSAPAQMVNYGEQLGSYKDMAQSGVRLNDGVYPSVSAKARVARAIARNTLVDQSALVQPDGTLKLPDNQQNLVIRTSYSDIQRGADGTLRIASPVIQGNVSGNVTLYVEGRGVENITVLNSR